MGCDRCYRWGDAGLVSQVLVVGCSKRSVIGGMMSGCDRCCRGTVSQVS